MDKKRGDNDNKEKTTTTSPDENTDTFNVTEEIAILVNKIVQEAISKAVRQQEVHAVAYTEIDINDTPTETSGNSNVKTMSRELIIEEPILEEEQRGEPHAKATLSPEGAAFYQSNHTSKLLLEKSPSLTAAADDEQPNMTSPTTTTNALNESSLTLNSTAVNKKLAHAKKDPIVDCFSCTII